MRVLVTGGAGFIGSHLVDALIARGEETLVVDDLSSGRRENVAEALDRGAELLEGDVSDAASVAAAFARARVEAVMHLAAQIDVRRSVADPAFDARVNVAGTINILEAARRAGVDRVVFASTGGAIYGEGGGRDLPLDEAAECRPDAPYGQSKLSAEGYLALYRRLFGLSSVALRLGNVYGPRQDPHGEAGVVAIFCEALRAGAQPRVFGDGRQTRDYIYVGDVVEAFCAALGSTAEGELNVGTGVETSVLELGRLLAQAWGSDFDPEMAPARPGEVQRIAISSERAQRELDWRVATPLQRGVELTVEAFEAAGQAGSGG